MAASPEPSSLLELVTHAPPRAATWASWLPPSFSTALASAASAVLGSGGGGGGGSDARPQSYEESHADAQAVMLPPTLPKGLNVSVTQGLTRALALTHRARLEPAPFVDNGQGLGPDPSGGRRSYAFGGALLGASGGGDLGGLGGLGGGLVHRLAASVDAENGVGRASLNSKSRDGSYALQASLLDARAVRGERELDEAGNETGRWRVAPVPASTQLAAALTVRGADYVAVARAHRAPVLSATYVRGGGGGGAGTSITALGTEAGLSYNQRLAPGSAVTLGGEAVLSLPRLWELARPSAPPPLFEPGQAQRAVDFAFGAAVEHGEAQAHKTALHFAFCGALGPVLGLHHVARPDRNSTLAAKLIVSQRPSSMCAAGYRVVFPNTLTTVHGCVDSYGTSKVVVERWLWKDFLKVGASVEARLGGEPEAPDGIAAFGFGVSLGQAPQATVPLSPAWMNRNNLFAV